MNYKRKYEHDFPSLIADGKVPLNSCSFVKKHLRCAAKAAGVQIADGQRFRLHNLRHSLSNWLVNKAKVEPKTVQGILRHSKIRSRRANSLVSSPLCSPETATYAW